MKHWQITFMIKIVGIILMVLQGEWIFVAAGAAIIFGATGFDLGHAKGMEKMKKIYEDHINKANNNVHKK